MSKGLMLDTNVLSELMRKTPAAALRSMRLQQKTTP